MTNWSADIAVIGELAGEIEVAEIEAEVIAEIAEAKDFADSEVESSEVVNFETDEADGSAVDGIGDSGDEGFADSSEDAAADVDGSVDSGAANEVVGAVVYGVDLSEDSERQIVLVRYMHCMLLKVVSLVSDSKSESCPQLSMCVLL